MGKRLGEIGAIVMIGDGIVSLADPTRHSLLWSIGPEPVERTMSWVAGRPNLTRLLSAAQVGAGFWLARRQLRSG